VLGLLSVESVEDRAAAVATAAAQLLLLRSQVQLQKAVGKGAFVAAFV
jgi:hypothetical protein